MLRALGRKIVELGIRVLHSADRESVRAIPPSRGGAFAKHPRRARARVDQTQTARSQRDFRDEEGKSALALVTGALEQFALLVLAHLLAPLLDHTTHG
jgi:hypothetical protein